ncbi:Hypothetical protein ETEE_2200 [Edwardsiella anguillarum ET080813]|uniref:Uncharacterized protein n=1 Tax=Edwardsiella anguillarum ET080813 TaxID=667120 RepID=A0A076LSS0_9GAMM|nr:Hypothetical protein ETEE_2200 [Edwardsiella anguillarum ET080813]
MCLPPQYREIDPIGNAEFIKFCRRTVNLTQILLFIIFINYGGEMQGKKPTLLTWQLVTLE